MSAMTAHAQATWPLPGRPMTLADLDELPDDGRRPDDFEVFPAPLDVDVSDDTRLQPDILVVRREFLGERKLIGIPDLAVEVLSPSTRRGRPSRG